MNKVNKIRGNQAVHLNCFFKIKIILAKHVIAQIKAKAMKDPFGKLFPNQREIQKVAIKITTKLSKI